ncbi:MAG: hypothetical protein SVV03_02150 [Candidatus Nanohaloarchaea archaeon]|nr:hypothetical protein [Candidatus Nanohaloarchaea archaeon]
MDRKGLLRILVIVTPLIVMSAVFMVWAGSGGGSIAKAEFQNQIKDIKPFSASRFLSQNLVSSYFRPSFKQEVHHKSFEIASEGFEIDRRSMSRSEFLGRVFQNLEESVKGEMDKIVSSLDVRSGCEIKNEKSGLTITFYEEPLLKDQRIGLVFSVENQADPLGVSCDSGSAEFNSYFSFGNKILAEDNRFREAAEIAFSVAQSSRIEGAQADSRELEEYYEEEYKKNEDRYRGFSVSIEQFEAGSRIEVKDERYRIPTKEGYKHLSFILEIS